MLALRYAALVALAVWVGGVLVLGGIAAPAIFDVVAAREVADGRLLAGAIFGEALGRFHLLSYGLGLFLFVALAARAVLGPRPARLAARLLLVTLMLVAAGYSGLVLTKQIDALRAEIGVAPSSLPDSDPRRAAFGRMHALSTALQLVPLAGGLLLLFFELKDSR
jgi:glucose dehydrogenase